MTAIDIDFDSDAGLVSTRFNGQYYEGMGFEVRGQANVRGNPYELGVGGVRNVYMDGHTIVIETGSGLGGLGL